MPTMDTPEMTSLDRIIEGLDPRDPLTYNADRTVSFGVIDGRLVIREECDSHYRTVLTGAQTEQLIAFLADLRRQLPD